MAIFSLIGSAIAGALFGGSALAATLIAGGLAYAASLGIQYLRRPKKRTYTAVQGETQYGGNVPVSTLYGVGKVKGHRTFYAKWGAGNKFNAEVFILANGWCDGLEPYIYFYGQKWNLHARAIIGNEAAHYGVDNFISGGVELFSIRFYDGRPGQGVDAKLVANTAALGQTWKPQSTNAGLCYVIVERLYDGGLFDKGKPDIEFVLRGLREYDPRYDSTIAGGSGSQRLSNPATWVHTQNPAVHRLNYQLGLRAMLSGRTLIGEGKSLGQIDLPTYFVAMNVCDTPRPRGGKTYQCSLWASGNDDHTEILKEFDDAMAGYGLNRRGLSGVIAGAPQIPVVEITPDDIPADRAKDFQFKKSAFDRYNHMSGQFTSIELMWNPESLKPVYVNADIAADGRSRQVSNDFLQVTDPNIAQYLLNIRYRQNRRGGTVTLPVSRRVGLKVQEGEWVTWRGKQWMVSEWLLDDRIRPTLKLAEAGADIYDDGGIEPGPVVIPPTAPVNPSILTTVQNFHAEAGIIAGGNGYDVPSLRFTWTPPSDPTITAVRFFYAIDGSIAEIFEDACFSPESGEFTTTKNVISNKIYVCRATITTVPDRFKTYTPWVTTSTETGTLSLIAYLKNLNKDVTDRFAEIQKDNQDALNLILDALTNFSLDAGVGQIQRNKIRAEAGRAFAEILEEKRVRVTADEALAQIIQLLQADYDSNKAAVATELSALADETDALALMTASLNVAVGDVSAQGLAKFSLAANQSGVDARYSISIRGTIGQTYKETGLFLELYTVSGVQRTRLAILADQFVVTNGTATTLPMVFEGGVLKLQVANIGTVTAGYLTGPSGKFVINLTQDYLSVDD
ncbi:UNVERIFIED_ORG: hypothetical protein J2W19_003123 [Shinella zoogloeoides]|nr:hypothetical protein [Shinella zoogloeoides]